MVLKEIVTINYISGMMVDENLMKNLPKWSALKIRPQLDYKNYLDIYIHCCVFLLRVLVDVSSVVFNYYYGCVQGNIINGAAIILLRKFSYKRYSQE